MQKIIEEIFSKWNYNLNTKISNLNEINFIEKSYTINICCGNKYCNEYQKRLINTSLLDFRRCAFLFFFYLV